MSKGDIMLLQQASVCYRTRKAFFRHSVFTALDQISFSIHRGETLGVVGRNGSGKSTLLRVLAGIYGVDAGKISWNCNQVSLLSLSLGFDPELTGWDNAILSGMLLGSRRSEVIGKMDEIHAFSELGKFLHKPVKTYSTGMRARLGFSVAITMRTELLLIDEVMSVGDAHFRAKAEAAMIEKITSDQSVVLVSHSQGQLRDLCDRVLWLDKGKLMMIGDSKEVLDEYQKFIEQ